MIDGLSDCFAENLNLEVVFLGDGDAEVELKQKWGDHPQVRFFPYLPFSQASVLIRESDFGLVSLEPGIHRVSFPSKVSTYLNLGIPLLVVVESESVLADLTRKNGLGVVPAEVSKSEISKALRELMRHGDGLGSAALGWYEANWSTEANHNAWLRLLSDNDNKAEPANS